jgi:membrane fusion protein (multidrug efflux system)
VIESTDPIHAYFNVSERDLTRIEQLAPQGPNAASSKLEMALGDRGEFDHEGKLDFSQLGVEPGTGTSLRRATFANPDGNLVPGMFVRVRVRLGKPEPRLLVQQRALGADQRGDFVLVVNDKNVVEYRPVELGASSDGMRVIERGLRPDEWIVVNGLQRARPGAEVTPEKAEDTAHVAAARLGKAASAHSEGE